MNIAFLALLLFFIYRMIFNPRSFYNAIIFMFVLLSGYGFIITYTPFTAIFQIIGLLIFSFFIFIVPFLLIFNGIDLLRKEGMSLSHILPLLFGISIILGELSFLYTIWTQSNQHTITPLWFNLAYLYFGITILFICLAFLVFLFYSLFLMILPKDRNFDYIIVLGCGLRNGLTPTKLLQDRLNKAIKIYHASWSPSKIICSGGQGIDEKISEALAMKNYLMSKDIPEHDILLEDQSTNTFENLANSQTIIQERQGRMLTCVVTSNYHVFRSMIYSERLNFPITAIGSQVAFYYWPSAMIREYVAICKRHIRLYIFCYLLFFTFLAFPLTIVLLGQ